MKKVIMVALFIFLIVVLAAVGYFYRPASPLINPVGEIVKSIKPKPLLEYSFENLKTTSFAPSQITLGRKIGETDESISQMFYFLAPKTPKGSEMIQVSGLANIPKTGGVHPVILMLRGYVSDAIFASGVGSQPAASVLVKNGYITLAPDFLGFGESASASADGFESRFQTYTTTLSLFASLPTLNTGLDASYSGQITAETDKVGIWAHSNGGHIALSTLAISGKSYPTVLWNPVSKPFPYSILYYTDEYDDNGKDLRKYLANFETDYDVEAFSPPNYYQWIQAPLQIHQGGADEEVLPFWSDELTTLLKKNKTSVEYYKYAGADHNLRPNGWESAVERSIQFYKKEL